MTLFSCFNFTYKQTNYRCLYTLNALKSRYYVNTTRPIHIFGSHLLLLRTEKFLGQQLL